jgi:DNA-directed RNA polymerase subunit M
MEEVSSTFSELYYAVSVLLSCNNAFYQTTPKVTKGVHEMEFCPKCGTLLNVKKTAEIVALVCPKCGYTKPEPPSAVSPTVDKVISHNPQQMVAVIDKKDAAKGTTLPTITIECPKCGNNTAYVWQVQTRGSDESSTQFLRCTRCNYTFRENT